MAQRAISFGSQFKRDVKKHYLALASTEWAEVLYYLCHDKPLPEKYCDHPLSGEWLDCRDCHVRPDLLLIYRKEGQFLQLLRLGSHSEIF